MAAHTGGVSSLGKPLLASICLVAGLALVVVLSQDREPYWQGRSLSQWLHTPPPPIRSPEDFGISNETRAGIRAMGTNAISTALRWISYEPSTLRQQARPLVHRIPQRFWPHFFSRDYHLAIDAEVIFYILGPSAKPAIPELTRLAMNSKGEARVGRCVRALAAIGPEALPALATIIENPQTKDRGYVVERVSFLEGPAVPVLLKFLQDPERDVAAMAATALGFLHLSNSTVIPALVANLQSTNAWRRCAVAAALARFGPDARPAIPALLQCLSDPDTDVTSQSALSLHQIEPETFTNEPQDW